MHIHGIVQSAELQEHPPGSEIIEMVLRVQGVGAGQPRRLIVPFDLLLQDPALEPEAVEGHAFEADVEPAEGTRWVVSRVSFAGGRVLRPKE
jgi:hypothetical protein